eukprot:3402923-Rhodomonas_salina.1
MRALQCNEAIHVRYSRPLFACAYSALQSLLEPMTTNLVIRNQGHETAIPVGPRRTVPQMSFCSYVCLNLRYTYREVNAFYRNTPSLGPGTSTAAFAPPTVSPWSWSCLGIGLR